MDRKVFERTKFAKWEWPRWRCPRCGGVPLQQQKLDVYENFESRKEQESPASEPEWAEKLFYAVLNCPDKACGDIVVVSGKAGNEDRTWGDWLTGQSRGNYEEVLMPLMVIPHIKFFAVPEKCPKTVRQYIDASFMSYFVNPAAALNEARKGLEVLLTENGVQELDEKGRRKPLGSRLQELPERLSPHAKHFSAVRWLGNAGSHPGEVIETKDVLDCYELLSGILDAIYSEKRDRLEELAKRIDANKGTLGPWGLNGPV